MPLSVKNYGTKTAVVFIMQLIIFIIVLAVSTISQADLRPCRAILAKVSSVTRGEPRSITKFLEEAVQKNRAPSKDAPGSFLTLYDGRKIHYYLHTSTAKGKPAKGIIVLVGGLTGHSDFWFQGGFIDTLLREGNNVVFIEPHGHGWTLLEERYQSLTKNTPLNDRYTVEDQVSAIYEVVKEVSPKEKVTFMGNSYGGWVGSALSAHPESQKYFKNFVLLAPGVESLHRNIPGFNELDSSLNLLKNLPGWNVAHASHIAQQEAWIKNEFPRYLKKHFASVQLESDVEREAAAARLFLGIWHYDSKKYAAKMHNIYLITAKKDEVIPRRDHDELSSALHNEGKLKGWIQVDQAHHDFSTGPKQIAIIASQLAHGEALAELIPQGKAKWRISLKQQILGPKTPLYSYKRLKIYDAAPDTMDELVHFWKP